MVALRRRPLIVGSTSRRGADRCTPSRGNRDGTLGERNCCGNLRADLARRMRR